MLILGDEEAVGDDEGVIYEPILGDGGSAGPHRAPGCHQCSSCGVSVPLPGCCGLYNSASGTHERIVFSRVHRTLSIPRSCAGGPTTTTFPAELVEPGREVLYERPTVTVLDIEVEEEGKPATKAPAVPPALPEGGFGGEFIRRAAQAPHRRAAHAARTRSRTSSRSPRVAAWLR